MITKRMDQPGLGSGRGWAAGRSRPHHWPCRHCGMVTDYHLLRDEVDRLITFKEWLRAYEWETDPRHLDDQAATDTNQATAADDGWTADQGKTEDWSHAGTTDVVVPQQRTASPDRDPVGAARQAVDSIPDADSLVDDSWSSPPLTAADEHFDADALGAGADWRWAS